MYILFILLSLMRMSDLILSSLFPSSYDLYLVLYCAKKDVYDELFFELTSLVHLDKSSASLVLTPSSRILIDHVGLLLKFFTATSNDKAIFPAQEPILIMKPECSASC
jgi:hypothetical protein